MFVPEICKLLSDEFSPQGYTIFTNTLPTFVLWLPSLFNSKINLTEDLNKTYHASNEKVSKSVSLNVSK